MAIDIANYKMKREIKEQHRKSLDLAFNNG